MKPLFLFLALFLFTACNSGNSAASEQTKETKNADSNDMGTLAFEKLDGSTIQLSELQGKRVFLSFWATWCKPCIKEMPSIEQAQTQLGDEVVFLLVSDEPTEKIKRFAEKKGYDLTFVRADFPLDQLGITGLPTNIIINSEGQKEEFLVGARDWHSEESLAMIKGSVN